jgi:hypothetical protein
MFSPVDGSVLVYQSVDEHCHEDPIILGGEENGERDKLNEMSQQNEGRPPVQRGFEREEVLFLFFHIFIVIIGFIGELSEK